MSSTTEHPTCADRLPANLAGRVEDLQGFVDRIGSQDWEDADAAYDEANCYGLGLSVTRVLRWDLSTGGPGDWIEFHVDSDGDLVRAEYVFQDWFDGAREEIEGDDYETVKEFYDIFFRDSIDYIGR